MNLLRHVGHFKKIRIAVIVFLLAAACSGRAAPDGVTALSALQARDLIEANRGDPGFVILDLRTPEEFRQGHIAGAVLLNYYNPGFMQALRGLDKTKRYLVYCRSGNRSAKAVSRIAGMGFAKVYHLSAGILAWQAEKLPLTNSA